MHLAAPAALCLLAVLAAPACGLAGDPSRPAPALEKRARDRLSRSGAGYEAVLLVDPERSTLHLTIEPRDASSRNGLTTEQRLALAEPLLREALQRHGRRPAYLLTVGEYPELGRRLAGAAACSGRWDLATGRPRDGDAAAGVTQLLADDRLYAELARLVAPLGYAPSVASAESVVVCPKSEITFEASASSCRPQLEEGALLPCGASIVFRLSARE